MTTLKQTYEQKLAAAKEWLGENYQGHVEYVAKHSHPKISQAHLQHKWAVKRVYNGN
jgi:hypothetical protein